MILQTAKSIVSRVQCMVLSDGMISSECNTPTGCKTSDGCLWFPTRKGIVVVNPKNMQKNSLAPQVIIERVVVDRMDYSLSENARFLPGNGQVEFHYGGVSFIAPQKVNFSYMLQGFEKEWRFVETRRAAFYTNLSPGKYVFRVTACNSDGVWNETGASFAFELEPHFYQTIWFYGLVFIFISGSGFLWYRIHIGQLLKRERELEQHVVERTAQLEAANKELEAFSYSVSHDLRAPLRSIDGFSSALLEDYLNLIDERGKDYLQRLHSASQRMEKLIDSILNLSRVTRSEIRRTNVDLSAIAQTIATELQTNDPDRRVEFFIEPGLIVQADENLMRIVLDNLLSNAWKFTSKHPTAKIELRATMQSGQRCYFVRDDGVGFNMLYAGKLFGAFQRMHPSAEFQGTGIGLATIQRIIHRHGGRVWAKPQ